MSQREVKGVDFSEDDLREFFDSVERLKAVPVSLCPDWVREIAERFAATNPRPGLEDLRIFVDHAVAGARGWDHPADRQMMFDNAVSAFYIVEWINYLQTSMHERMAPGKRVDLSYAFKVSFTPIVKHSPS